MKHYNIGGQVGILREGVWPQGVKLDQNRHLNYGTLISNDIDADDWEVVPKLVGSDEAWKALMQGKRIKANGNGPYSLVMDGLWKLRNEGSGEITYTIPISWIAQDIFEILED